VSGIFSGDADSRRSFPLPPVVPLSDSETTDAGRLVMGDAAVKEDPRAALAWAQSITDETRRQKSIESVLHLWRTFDPVEAASYAASATGD
jgi:hypothetical protein